MNSYSVRYFPEGWKSSDPAQITTVIAQEFIIDSEYVVFVDDSVPPRAVFALPHTAIPVITRIATAVSS